MIHVCYGLYDGNGRYSKFTGTSMLSMFENVTAPPHSVTVHILHDDTLTDDNRDKFSYIAGQYNQLIKFYNVEKVCADDIQKLKSLFSAQKAFKTFTIGTLLRLLMTKIFADDITKLIYLDSDTIVNLDIAELWQIPLADKTIAACTEKENGCDVSLFSILCKDGFVNPTDYFNAGVLVINLDKLRGNYETLQAGIKFIADNPQYNQFLDQDILNYCFSKSMVKLPRRFNFSVRNRGEQGVHVKNKICHYLAKTLTLNRNDKFNRLWFNYFTKTLWFNEETIFHFYDELIEAATELKNIAIQTSALMSDRSRAFFVEKMNIEFLKKVFIVREGEEIIPAVNQASVQALIESMKASAGKKFYFILITNDYKFLSAYLINAGFVEGRDFIDAMNFLSPIHGAPMNMYYENSLIKAL